MFTSVNFFFSPVVVVVFFFCDSILDLKKACQKTYGSTISDVMSGFFFCFFVLYVNRCHTVLMGEVFLKSICTGFVESLFYFGRASYI